MAPRVRVIARELQVKSIDREHISRAGILWDGRMHYLSVACIFKCEWHWLREWLDYYDAVGVEHFFLINNDDDPKVAEKIIRPYVDSGVITYVARRGGHIQLEAYNWAVREAMHKTHWLAIVDADEFIFPRTSHDLRIPLKAYEGASGVAINWQCFGSSGLVQRPPNQLNYFIYKAESDWEVNRHVKCVVRPNMVANYVNCHYAEFRHGIAVDERHAPLSGPMSLQVNREIFQINHYVVRSRQDFDEVKVPRGRCRDGHAFRPEWAKWYWETHDRNEVFDGEISGRFGGSLNMRRVPPGMD